MAAPPIDLNALPAAEPMVRAAVGALPAIAGAAPAMDGKKGSALYRKAMASAATVAASHLMWKSKALPPPKGPGWWPRGSSLTGAARPAPVSVYEDEWDNYGKPHAENQKALVPVDYFKPTFDESLTDASGRKVLRGGTTPNPNAPNTTAVAIRPGGEVVPFKPHAETPEMWGTTHVHTPSMEVVPYSNVQHVPRTPQGEIYNYGTYDRSAARDVIGGYEEGNFNMGPHRFGGGGGGGGGGGPSWRKRSNQQTRWTPDKPNFPWQPDPVESIVAGGGASRSFRGGGGGPTGGDWGVLTEDDACSRSLLPVYAGVLSYLVSR